MLRNESIIPDISGLESVVKNVSKGWTDAKTTGTGQRLAVDKKGRASWAGCGEHSGV